MTQPILLVEFPADATLADCALMAWQMQMRLGYSIKGDFNGIPLIIHWGQSPEDAIEAYKATLADYSR